MGRSPCCSESDVGLKKGPWTQEEDEILVDYINKKGHESWRALPKRAGLNRCGKSCRLRWTNYLRPDIKRGNFSEEEEQAIIDLHYLLGNKWSKIAAHLPGRTDNEIKNFWNTHMRKKLLHRGIDPKTHKPISDLNLLANLSQLLSPPNLFQSVLNPWDNALGLQSNATQLAKLQLLQNMLQVINTSHFQNIPQNNLLGSNNFAQFDGLNSETINHYNSCGFSSDVTNFNANSLSSACNTSTDNSLPALVSAAPDISNVNQTDSANPIYVTNNSPSSNIFEDWEHFVDDEANDSFWKDIME